jgi:AraC-like DNA-binding protein
MQTESMKHGKSPYTSAFYVWNGSSAVFFSSCLTPFHSHNTMQLVLDTHTNFRFRVKNGSWGTYRSLIIKENVIHQLDTNSSVQLIIYLAAESEIARAIKSRALFENDIYSPDLNIFHLVNSNELEQALVNPEPGKLWALIDNVLRNLSREITIAATDKRIAFIQQAISTLHPDDTSIKSLAAKVYLSESRLRSLFKKVIGVPLHRYILWNKIRFATNQIMAGDSVNEAAMDAGFTDSSHFHKMMVKMFGESPSGFLKNNKSKHRVLCDEDPLDFKTRYYQ